MYMSIVKRPDPETQNSLGSAGQPAVVQSVGLAPGTFTATPGVPTTVSGSAVVAVAAGTSAIVEIVDGTTCNTHVKPRIQPHEKRLTVSINVRHVRYDYSVASAEVLGSVKILVPPLASSDSRCIYNCVLGFD